MQKALLVILFTFSALAGDIGHGTWLAKANAAELSQSDAILASSYRNRVGNIQVQGRGTVDRILSDDNDGSRHQRFTLRLASGQSLLIAHNIDLAPRIGPINVGDTIDFNGVYEWHPQGGVIHWTHRDPAGRHQAGWLAHRGLIYQ